MAEFVFWGTLALIAFSYFGYPVILSLLALGKKPAMKDEGIFPYVSLIIPAHNEEFVIGDKLQNCLRLDYPEDKLEVMLILDGCTDRTKEFARGYADMRIKIIEQTPRRGKMAALNLAVPQARGEIIVFTDANSIYEKGAIRKLVRHFADEKIGCTCGELKYVNKSLIGEGEGLYWRYEKYIKIKESQLRSLLVVNGSIYAIRKKLFEPVEETLADDFVVPMGIAKKGYGLVYEPEAIAIEKTAETTKEGFNQKVRIVSQGLKASFAIWGTIMSSGYLRVFQFMCHKFIRWFVPIFLIAIIISNALLLKGPLYKALFFGQIIFYISGLVGYLLQEIGIKIKVFNIPFYFCIVNLASFLGIIKFLRGGIRATWEKAETTRR